MLKRCISEVYRASVQRCLRWSWIRSFVGLLGVGEEARSWLEHGLEMELYGVLRRVAREVWREVSSYKLKVM